MYSARILVTRPSPQGEALCAALRAVGAAPIFFPTLQIVPQPLQQPVHTMIAGCIFMSPQAVWTSFPSLHLPSTAWIAAVGAGTAQALHEAGIASVIYPEQDWSSEGLLQLPKLQAVQGQEIALVCGAGGRPLLAETLQARGAIVHHWISYRRELPVYADLENYLDLFRQQKVDMIVCTSGESLQNLLRLVDSLPASFILSVPLIVVSSRLATLAQQYKFQQIFVAENASHSAIITIGNQICRKIQQK